MKPTTKPKPRKQPEKIQAFLGELRENKSHHPAPRMLYDLSTQSEGFYVNDSQIADLRCVKGWGDRPGIRITLERLLK